MKRRIVIPPEKRSVAPVPDETAPRERRKLGLNYGGAEPATPLEEHAS